MKKRKFSLRLFLIFIITFLFISFIHISFNATIIARQPSPNWSRGIEVTTTPFTREIVAGMTSERDILIIAPIKDGKEILKITKLNKDMQIKEEYEASIDKFNINTITSDDIQLIGNNLYWRDNKESALYTSTLDDASKRFGEVVKLNENVVDFQVAEDARYLVVVLSGGKVALYKEQGGEYIELEGPSDLSNIQMVNIITNNDTIYLQTAIYNEENSNKEVYITEYKDNKWAKSVYMTSLLEVKNQIKDIELAVDKDYVYSISSVQGDDKTSYTYLINGYSKDTKESFEEIKAKWAIDLKVQYFSSKPVIFDSEEEGLTVFTTAPSNLDVRATSSNVIKLNLTKDGFKSAELVSNTKKWSNQVVVLRDNNTDYVLWNESGGFGSTIIMGTSNDRTVIENHANITTKDIKDAIAEEVPHIVNLLIVSVGARLFSIFPSIIWLLCMFMWNSVMEKRYNLYLIIGMIIHLIFQAISIDFYYGKSYIMPDFLTLNLVKHMIPFLFAALAGIVSYIYKKEADEPQSYKVYALFIVYYHIFINYLFVPYLFNAN